MARKTQEEINYWFQDNTFKSALDLSLIEKKLYINNLDIPNNIVIHKNGSTYEDFVQWYYNVIKISKYPTSYEECCKITKDVADASLTCFACKLLNDFQKLLLCRDAYWEIAGDAMGLGKPWEPDWEASIMNDNTQKYCIYVAKNKIVSGYVFNENKILAFPTEEMKDAFLNNFKDLIESCKTLL